MSENHNCFIILSPKLWEKYLNDDNCMQNVTTLGFLDMGILCTRMYWWPLQNIFQHAELLGWYYCSLLTVVLVCYCC